MNLRVASVAILSVMCLSGQTPNPELSRLLKAKTLRCTFTQGSNAEWESGKPEIRPANFGADLIFDAINKKARTAKLIGNQGSTQVTVKITMGGLTFTELTGSGSVMITTIFPRYAKGTNEFIVVHSRHFIGLVGDPLPSQYHGTCKVLD